MSENIVAQKDGNMQEDRFERIQRVIKPLTDDQRNQAALAADKAVVNLAGEKPRRDDFKEEIISEYPSAFVITVAIGMLIILGGMALISLFRVFSTARAAFLASGGDHVQGIIAGFVFFIAAEASVFVFTLGARVFVKSRWIIVACYALAFVAGIVAIVGNAAVTQPVLRMTWDDVWTLLETFGPPLFVMGVALVSEFFVLTTLKNRQANDNLYKAALNEWRAETKDPRQHEQWPTKYRTMLREMLRQVNGRGQGKTARLELMATLDRHEWTMLVMREEAADEWYTGGDANPLQPRPASMGSAFGSGQLLPTPSNQRD